MPLLHLSKSPIRRAATHLHPLYDPFSSASDDNATLTVETSVPYVGHNLADLPTRSVETSPKELMSFFQKMHVMRRMEITADSLYKAKLIRGFYHICDDQEAVPIGKEVVITKQENVITAYRDHCTYLARGGTLFEAFVELMGRRDRVSSGKGGSMHFYKPDCDLYGGHRIVGAQVPVDATWHCM